MKLIKTILIIVVFMYMSCEIEKNKKSDTQTPENDFSDYSSEELKVKVKDEIISINTKNNIKLPENFPDDIYIYKNAILKKVDTYANKHSLTLQSSDSSNQILEIYKSKMKEFNWEKKSEMKSDKNVILLYKKGKRNTNISISMNIDKTLIDIKTDK